MCTRFNKKDTENIGERKTSDILLEFTISRNFQETSLSDFETLHHLCQLERTQILQSLALPVVKKLYTEYFVSGNRFKF